MVCGKKTVFVLTALGFVIFTIYLSMFRHPPTEVILAANNREKQTMEKLHLPGDPEYDPYVEAEKAWNNFVIRNDYVSIGSIYDSCDENDRFVVGTVILLPDLRYGGVTSRIFVNMSIESDITEGTFHVEVKYNGQDLYQNNVDVCYHDPRLPDSKRLVVCPISAGYQTYDKFVKIPRFIPKGRYRVDAWASNPEGVIIVCAYAEFVL